MPALRTLKLLEEYKWAWYTDPQCDGLESSPNLVFHVLFSNDEEVHQRLVTQALRAIPSEEIEYLESGESYSVPKRDVCRLLLSLLPSLKTLAFCLRPYGRDQWLIVLRECAASTFNKKLTTIQLRDEEGGRPYVPPRHRVSDITANLRDLLDTYVTHGRSVDRFVIRANWLEHGKEEVEVSP